MKNIIEYALLKSLLNRDLISQSEYNKAIEILNKEEYKKVV